MAGFAGEARDAETAATVPIRPSSCSDFRIHRLDRPFISDRGCRWRPTGSIARRDGVVLAGHRVRGEARCRTGVSRGIVRRRDGPPDARALPKSLLQGVAAHSGERISRLPLLTESERRRLIEVWNPPPGLVESRGPLRHEMFAAQAATTPDAVAIVFEGQRMTYRELDERSNRLAHLLRRHGVGPDVPVGLCLGRSPDLVAAILAIMKAGGAFVPLEPSFPPAQLGALLAEVRPAVVIAESRSLGRIPHDGRTVLCLDREAEAIAGESPTAPNIRVSDENLAMIMFSSGTTGRPKAISRTHGAWRFGGWARSTFQLGESDRHVLKTTLDSSLLLLEVFWPLLTGGRMIIAGPQVAGDTSALVGLLADHRITFMALIPSLLRPLVEEEGMEACTALRQVVCFGEPLPSDVEARFCRRVTSSLGIIYGTTEVPVLAFRQCRGDGPRPLGNLGFPVSGSQIYVLDEWLQPVPIGVPGEPLCRRPEFVRWLLGRPRAGGESLYPASVPRAAPPARLFRTGDRARWRPGRLAGDLPRLGSDDQVKIRGYRIEPAEFEAAALVRHPGVREGRRGRSPGSRRRQSTGSPMSRPCRGGLTIGELRAHLESGSPAHMIPSVFVEARRRLPRRPQWQVGPRRAAGARVRPPGDRRAVRRAPDLDGSDAGPRIWAEVLGLERASIHDNFFDLGGTSLKATRLLAAIDGVCGRRPSQATLNLHPTNARLADLLDAGETISYAGSIVAGATRRGEGPRSTSQGRCSAGRSSANQS